MGGGRLFAIALVPKDISCRDEGFDDGEFRSNSIPVPAEPDSRSRVWEEEEDISALRNLSQNFLGENEKKGDRKVFSKGYR